MRPRLGIRDDEGVNTIRGMQIRSGAPSESRTLRTSWREFEGSPVTSFASIFQEHSGFVWRALLRLGVPTGDADDALQEVFLVVHRRLADYKDQGHMRAWLFSISRQIASHYHRAQKRRHERERYSIEHSAHLDQHEVLARREAEHLVNSFLERLDEPRRLVFYLSDIEGLPAPEIAGALGMNLNTVYGRLRQARARFEEAIQAFGRGE